MKRSFSAVATCSVYVKDGLALREVLSRSSQGRGCNCMGARAPQPQSGRVMGIAEIRGGKIGGGWGYRIILAEQITLKYIF